MSSPFNAYVAAVKADVAKKAAAKYKAVVAKYAAVAREVSPAYAPAYAWPKPERA